MADVTEILSKDDLLASMIDERAQLDALFTSIDDARMLEVMREDGWTAKDMLAHITTWEQRLLRWIDRWRITGKPERPEPGIAWGTQDNSGLDRLNARDYDAAKSKSIDEVRNEAADSRERVMDVVSALTEAELIERTPAWDSIALSWVVRANTDEHYREHRGEIEAWLREHSA